MSRTSATTRTFRWTGARSKSWCRRRSTACRSSSRRGSPAAGRASGRSRPTTTRSSAGRRASRASSSPSASAATASSTLPPPAGMSPSGSWTASPPSTSRSSIPAASRGAVPGSMTEAPTRSNAHTWAETSLGMGVDNDLGDRRRESMRGRTWPTKAAAVLVAIVACGFAAPALAQKTVKIGVLTPLSPPGDASAGQFIVRGAKMGAENVNARGGVLGGRQIELVVEDDAGTPEKGVAGLRKLATQDQVAAVIGQFHSSVMGAVQTLAEQFEIPVFSTQASARGITEQHLNYTFRTHVIDPDRVQLWNRWIKQHGFKRVTLLTENTDYGVGLVEETKKQFKTMEVQAELKTIIFDRAVVDLTPQLLEIKNWNPDIVLNGGIGTP